MKIGDAFAPKPGGKSPIVYIIRGIIVFVVLIVIFALSKPHWYLFERVNPDQIGIKTRGGQIVEVVPAGIYSDIGLFVSLEKYSTLAFQFTSTDPEVITQDNQRLGVTVTGSSFRPQYTTDERVLANLWTKYRTIYTSDTALQQVLNDLSFQAMKVCVGNKPFQDSVIGSDRDFCAPVLMRN